MSVVWGLCTELHREYMTAAEATVYMPLDGDGSPSIMVMCFVDAEWLGVCPPFAV